MAAADARQMSASLALVQSAGATALELPMPTDAPMVVDFGCAQSPVAMSPWACSTEACGSPWSPATPAVVSSFSIKAAQVRSPAPSTSPFFPGPSLPEAHAQTFPVKPFSVGGFTPASPVGFAPTAMSPTTQIRQNAASFGIPLNASYGEIGAPLPVRTQAGILVAPSPTTRGSSALPSMPPAAAGAPGAPGSLQFIRSIATPLTASHPRRAAGGA
mmetsp:Transcript_56427/g.167983  ORF Transcript_56427/g.167983 Transcript_56427/m.167983 type:complete len:216 (+) Transcript_56427:32-679(+)|eukprot:CAMPEP_0175262446 /NCGR_PEP_ID=MMETSP0093-20121207/41278_1 /TAXON_ID=311494 /ORGANISM="Alexandrium monilatum, Strain CCMP3105" /LENGTH=215 /DNA_ID=CAMNT_0016556933 /DNA_START=32 /DNA_END=679 /DNA_ORIENTATION=+